MFLKMLHNQEDYNKIKLMLFILSKHFYIYLKIMTQGLLWDKQINYNSQAPCAHLSGRGQCQG